jgi:hypothetical protein
MKLIIEDGIPENAEGYETQQRMLQVFEQCLHLQQRKGRTYRNAWREQGYMGNVARVLSKASRLKSMLWRDQAEYVAPDEEPAEDTLHDLINIAAFAVMNLAERNRWGT